MNTSQGIVEVVTEKPAGKGTAYNFKLNDGNWYGHGFKKPAFSKGASIKFAWEANGNWKNVDADTVVVMESTKPVVHTAQSTGTDWDAKDRRITFLACRKDSIEMTKMALQEGALKLGAKNKLEVLIASVDELANDLYSGVYDEPFKEAKQVEQFNEEETNSSYE